jgi:hypothetical protein
VPPVRALAACSAAAACSPAVTHQQGAEGIGGDGHDGGGGERDDGERVRGPRERAGLPKARPAPRHARHLPHPRRRPAAAGGRGRAVVLKDADGARVEDQQPARARAAPDQHPTGLGRLGLAGGAQRAEQLAQVRVEDGDDQGGGGGGARRVLGRVGGGEAEAEAGVEDGVEAAARDARADLLTAKRADDLRQRTGAASGAMREIRLRPPPPPPQTELCERVKTPPSNGLESRSSESPGALGGRLSCLEGDVWRAARPGASAQSDLRVAEAEAVRDGEVLEAQDREGQGAVVVARGTPAQREDGLLAVEPRDARAGGALEPQVHLLARVSQVLQRDLGPPDQPGGGNVVRPSALRFGVA